MAISAIEVGRETVSIPEAGRRLGIGRNLAYDLARRDELPVPVIRLGSRMVVSRRALEEVLNERKSGDASVA